MGLNFRGVDGAGTGGNLAKDGIRARKCLAWTGFGAYTRKINEARDRQFYRDDETIQTTDNQTPVKAFVCANRENKEREHLNVLPSILVFNFSVLTFLFSRLVFSFFLQIRANETFFKWFYSGKHLGTIKGFEIHPVRKSLSENNTFLIYHN